MTHQAPGESGKAKEVAKPPLWLSHPLAAAARHCEPKVKQSQATEDKVEKEIAITLETNSKHSSSTPGEKRSCRHFSRGKPATNSN